ISFSAEKEIPLCKKVHRHLIYPVPIATHQVVGRGIIFLFMGGKFSFLCKSLNRYLSYISYSADSE
ncbi:hypothetical protein M2T26_18910, partial [Escherichia coli]|nr:hypothetical protein [Escherichia coli]